MSRSSIPEPVRAALEASGLPWEVRQRKKHQQLVLAGRVVGVVSRGAGRAPPRGGTSTWSPQYGAQPV